MKGGSVASSAVTNLVSPEMYDSMSKNFDNNLDSSCLDGGKLKTKRTISKKTKKGGSDASNAVIQLVDPAAFDKLSTNFDNTIQCGGCSCGAGKTGKRCKCGCSNAGKTVKKTKCKTGGSDGIWKTVMKDISEQFAGAGLHQKAGAEFDISNFKNINDYESSGVNITNKKKMGGACDTTPTNFVGLDYSGIKYNSAQGIPFDRNLSTDVLLTMTDSSINTSGISSMNKVVEFGGIDSSPSAFSFAGLTGGKGKGKAKWESIGKQIKLKDGSKRTVYKNSKNGKFAIKKIVDNKVTYKVIKY